MRSFTVKNLIVPLSDYATVSDAATLLESVKSFKDAHAALDKKRYRHRAVLVIDKNNHLAGKLSRHDVQTKNIMYTPGKGELVNESTTMGEAIRRLIIGYHHSLMVTADHDARDNRRCTLTHGCF